MRKTKNIVVSVMEEFWRRFYRPPKEIEKYFEEGLKLLSSISPEKITEFIRAERDLPITIVRHEEYYYVYCDVAGCTKDDVELYDREEGFLIVANRKTPEEVEIGDEVIDELKFGKLRTFVPIKISDPAEVETSIENGILRLKIPEYKGKKIEIQ
jgi:HSP20 family molecular chaperone IbpA